MGLLYSLGIKLYGLAILLASPFHTKAKQFITGRKQGREKLRHWCAANPGSLWVHCASLGEYEQAVPLIHAFRKEFPSQSILVTYFSPSGFEHHRPGLESHVAYLPLDTQHNAKQFLDMVRPAAAFFIKYEIWHHLVREIDSRGIPLYLVAAHFRKDQVYFRPYGSWFRKSLQCFRHIFLQKKESAGLLEGIGIKQHTVSGDTRLDRVLQNIVEPPSNPVVENFLAGEKALILGSAWEEETTLIAAYLKKQNYAGKVIIAPHDISPAMISAVKEKLAPIQAECLSNYTGETQPQVLIIDTIGQLKYLYQYARIALIGGAFGKGLHNILEAVAFGLPVIFGPHYRNFPEAAELIGLKNAYSVKDEQELTAVLDMLNSKPMLLKVIADTNRKYLQDHSGATERVMAVIRDQVLKV